MYVVERLLWRATEVVLLLFGLIQRDVKWFVALHLEERKPIGFLQDDSVTDNERCQVFHNK